MRLRVAPGHGPGCSVAKPSRTHSFTALVNHTARAATAAAASVVRCRLEAMVAGHIGDLDQV
jgi:hypothetical protein